nr:thiamine pyrophosphate-binding protein [Bifidobacterium dentium]
MTDENENVQRQNLTDSPHYLARVLMENGIRNMYGVVGIPVTDFARIAQGMGMRYIGMRHEEDAVNARGRWIHYRQAIGGPDRIRPRFPQRIAGIA